MAPGMPNEKSRTVRPVHGPATVHPRFSQNLPDGPGFQIDAALWDTSNYYTALGARQMPLGQAGRSTPVVAWPYSIDTRGVMTKWTAHPRLVGRLAQGAMGDEVALGG